MNEKHPINNMMETTMAKIRDMVDVNTVVGEPILAGDVTIIPVSRVSFGFGSGGSDFVSKHQKEGSENPFGGGAGAGVSINPIGFLVVKGDSVRMLPIPMPAGSTADRVIEMIPDMVDKIAGMIPKKDKEAEGEAETEVAAE